MTGRALRRIRVPHEVRGRVRGRTGRRAQQGQRRDRGRPADPQRLPVDADHRLPAGAADRRDPSLRDEPSQGGGGRVMQFGQGTRQARHQGPAEDDVRRRRRCRRGDRGAPGGQGVPRRTRRSSRRWARRSRAACCCSGRPGSGKTLLARAVAGEAGVPFYSIIGLGLRRDVRRRGRRPRPRPVRAGQGERAGDRVHRRDRRRRAPPRRRPRRRARRARTDAEPAAGRDGRVRPAHGGDPDGGDEPPRHPRPGAPAAGSVRPPGRGRPARPRGPQGDPEGARAAASRSTRRST